MGPIKKKELSESDGNLVAVAGAAAAREVLEELTPTKGVPMHGDSSEHLRLVARDEVSTHERNCHGLGRLERWVREMQKTVDEHRDVISQYLGEQKLKRFVIPVLVSFLGSAAGVALMVLIFKSIVLAIVKTLP